MGKNERKEIIEAEEEKKRKTHREEDKNRKLLLNVGTIKGIN